MYMNITRGYIMELKGVICGIILLFIIITLIFLFVRKNNNTIKNLSSSMGLNFARDLTRTRIRKN